MKKIDEKELKIIFQGIKDGNKDDIELLYKNYYSIVYGVAFSILKNKENSEDVTSIILLSNLFWCNMKFIPRIRNPNPKVKCLVRFTFQTYPFETT